MTTTNLSSSRDFHIIHFDDELSTVAWTLEAIFLELCDYFPELEEVDENEDSNSNGEDTRSYTTTIPAGDSPCLTLHHTICASAQEFEDAIKGIPISEHEHTAIILDWMAQTEAKFGCVGTEVYRRIPGSVPVLNRFILSGYLGKVPSPIVEEVTPEHVFSKPPDVAKFVKIVVTSLIPSIWLSNK